MVEIVRAAKLTAIGYPLPASYAGAERDPTATEQRVREMRDAMRDDRNARREQTAKVMAALPPPAPLPQRRSPWWRLSRG